MVMMSGATFISVGCIGTTSNGDGDDTGIDSGFTKNIIYEGSERESIQEDQYIRWAIDIDEAATIDYTVNVVDGSNIDVVLMDDTSLDEFKNGQEYRYYPDVSAMDTSYASREGRVDAGNYLIIIDNSNLGEAKPPTDFEDSIVTVELEYEVYN